MSGPTPALTRRQRTAPPINRWQARRLESGGGYRFPDPQTLAVGIEDEKTRYPGTVNDTEIMRDRWPWYPRDRHTPPADSWVNWTAAGPRRPELHMRNVSYRKMRGNSASRFPVVMGAPTTGMHTMGPAGVQRTAQRYMRTPQMVPARPFRLSPGQYASQTYSQTTRLQGR